MDLFLTVMFWSGVLSLLVRSAWLIGEHPRTQTFNVGADTFGWLLAAITLAWVSYLKFFA